jgi:hypothetical protein
MEVGLFQPVMMMKKNPDKRETKATQGEIEPIEWEISNLHFILTLVPRLFRSHCNNITKQVQVNNK